MTIDQPEQKALGKSVAHTDSNTKLIVVSSSDAGSKHLKKHVAALPPIEINEAGIRHSRLLVLDLDQTLVDYTGTNVHDPPTGVFRPHMKSFLRRVSKYYDIGIWSLSTPAALAAKIHHMDLPSLGITPVFVIDRTISIKCKFKSHRLAGTYYAKPMTHVARCLKGRYSSRQMMHVDDNPLCFTLSDRNCILISPWRRDPVDAEPYFGYTTSVGRHDRDLADMGKYLEIVRDEPNFKVIKHTNWIGIVKAHRAEAARMGSRAKSCSWKSLSSKASKSSVAPSSFIARRSPSGTLEIM